MDLVALNDHLQGEYRRIVGGSNRFEYLSWITERTRDVMVAQHEDRRLAVWMWSGLTKAEQRVRVVSYLRALPPAPGRLPAPTRARP